MENLNFHDRTYYVSMKMSPTNDRLRILKVQAVVHHSLGSDYFANVYIPEQYQVLNKEPYLGAEAIPGYKAYNMNMKRKYRDVLSTEDFIIAPMKKAMEMPSLLLNLVQQTTDSGSQLHSTKTPKTAQTVGLDTVTGKGKIIDIVA